VGMACNPVTRAAMQHVGSSARAGAEPTRLMRSVSCMGSSLLDSRRTSSRDRLRDSASSAHTWFPTPSC